MSLSFSGPQTDAAPGPAPVLEDIARPAPKLLSPGRALLVTLSAGLLFALVGLAIGLRVVAQATLPHILQAGEYINFQDVAEGLPIPRLLAWNVEQIDFLDTLRGMGAFALLLAAPLVFGPLWLLCMRLVNPTFRLFGIAPTSVTPPIRTKTTFKPTADAASHIETHSSDVTLNAPFANPPASDRPPIETVMSDALPANAPEIEEAERASFDEDTAEPALSVVSAPAPPADVPAAVIVPAAPPVDRLNAIVELYGLVKALTLLVMIGLPLAAVWILIDFDGDLFERGLNAQALSTSPPLIGAVWLMRFALLGAGFWIGFHRDGVAGDFTQPEWNLRSRRLFALGIQGLAFGLVMYLLCRLGLPQHLQEPLIRLQTLGALTVPLWKWVTLRCLLCFGGVWFAMGAAFALFARRDIARLPRLLLCLVPLAGLGIALIAQRDFTPAYLAARFDVRPALLQTLPDSAFARPGTPTLSEPDNLEAARQMTQLLRLPPISPKTPGRALVMFNQSLPFLFYQHNFTIDNLPADPTTEGLVTDFLRRRDYQTAFSWMATKHLFNSALMRLDNTSAMRAGLLDLTHSPHNTQFGRPTLLPMLSICAATPQNLALLDQWADQSKFETPDRGSNRLLGDLYRRFGRPDTALNWYRRADMPTSFLKRVGAEKPLFNSGHIDGVLRLNGKPLTGVQVAALPIRLNGLPPYQFFPGFRGNRSLEEVILDARQEILYADSRRINPAFGPLHPQPYNLRWISASTTTDAQGAYHLDALTEGEYAVICTLPRDIQPRLPEDDRLRFSSPPRPFTVNYRHPTRDLGITEITFASSVPATK